MKRRPEGMPTVDDFGIVAETFKDPVDGEVLLESLYISVDPYLRGRMNGTKPPRFEIGRPISSRMIARVAESKNDQFRVGDHVMHYLDWREWQVSDGSGLMKLAAGDVPLTAYLGVLGITGLSAYFAMHDYGKPKAGETLVVSGAAGAVGSIAGRSPITMIRRLWVRAFHHWLFINFFTSRDS